MNQYKPDNVRVVYGAAAKYRNYSLNDQLLKDADLLSNLVSIVIRFRLGQFAVTSDIEQMFHQVRVREEDRDALRFLWRGNPNNYIHGYKMNVHLFGKNDSPCVVNFVIKKIAKDKYDTDHVVAKSIEEDIYMDDFIKSGNSLETLLYAITSVINTLSQYGFRLHKWISNNEYLLYKIPESEKASTNQAKILGINWDIESDNLSLREINKSFIPTKQGMLSVLCSIYDPLGFIAPCILEPKLIIQECWKRNLDWDDPLPCDLLSRFEKWQKELYLIKDIQVPRFYGFNEHKQDTVELYMFTDSSQLAYGTCAYFRNIQGNNIKIPFIIGKSRLAPLTSEISVFCIKFYSSAAVLPSSLLVAHNSKFIYIHISYLRHLLYWYV